MKTILQVEIDHKKPLPTKVPLTDIASQRLYSYLYASGVEAGVKAKLLTETQRDSGPEDE